MPYHIGELKWDPHVENYPHRGMRGQKEVDEHHDPSSFATILVPSSGLVSSEFRASGSNGAESLVSRTRALSRLDPGFKLRV